MIKLATGLSFAAQNFALKWAKENLSEEEYIKIKNSYNSLIKKTIIFVITCCIPIIIGFLFFVFNNPVSKSIEKSSTPPGATKYIIARVDYRGNFFWTNKSKAYNHPIKNYGLSPENYKFGDELKVYINDNQDIIKVEDVGLNLDMRFIESMIGVVFAILVPVLLIILVYMPFAYRTFGKPWIEFYREFTTK